MSKSGRPLNRLQGKKLVFQGKFDYGEKDRLLKMAEAQQGRAVAQLDGKVDYLVVPDLPPAKTLQQKVASLNAKGAAIQVLDPDGFEKLVRPTDDEIVQLLRAGKAGAEAIRVLVDQPESFKPRNIGGEKLDGLDLTRFFMDKLRFSRCSFVGANLDRAWFGTATDCDFSKAAAPSAQFNDSVDGSCFQGAKLNEASIDASIANADFTGATLDKATISHMLASNRKRGGAKATFRKASCRSTEFQEAHLTSPCFDEADLTGAIFGDSKLEQASFRKAILHKTSLVGCKLPGADFTGASLRDANLANADLTGARFDGADLAGCNLRGAKLGGVDLSKAKNHAASEKAAGSIGPALKEFATVGKKAKRVRITFRMEDGSPEGAEVGLDTQYLKYGWGLRVPDSIAGFGMFQKTSGDCARAMLELANLAGHWPVRFETVEVKTTKSPLPGPGLRDLVLRSIAEAFAQPVPDADQLKAATQSHREKAARQQAVVKKKREAAQAAETARQQKAKEQAIAKISQAAGKVTDIDSFLKALGVRADKAKVDKATSMLKASGFQLFNDVSDQSLTGVVKSQTDPDLVYACRIDHEGHYACCTQNLNICGGLRGSICKHLLVLIIGLVKAGQLDPAAIDAWIARTHQSKPELDKEVMGAIFIKYKGAEAGEIDWRPTQTLPEDYYTL